MHEPACNWSSVFQGENACQVRSQDMLAAARDASVADDPVPFSSSSPSPPQANSPPSLLQRDPPSCFIQKVSQRHPYTLEASTRQNSSLVDCCELYCNTKEPSTILPQVVRVRGKPKLQRSLIFASPIALYFFYDLDPQLWIPLHLLE
ncbi:hypothetical protein GOP47_0018517 [Adiantum capillus-veneris]|uniref:Uncharacterized protein n=1 Tax=Adiantum capillus-veneris TaxID=13818 RepID=A0A9D4UD97_ADICA|nr:hypothetical protein GOP47_0018517 [Adiantum capillus-veneris]